MTAPDDLTGAWLPGPAQFGAPGCTCRPFTADPPRFLDQPGDSVDAHASWQRGADCVHHAAEAERDEDSGSSGNTPCRSTQHCAYHGWCRRCAPDFATTMSRINIAIQHTDPDESHWGDLYEAIGKALRDGEQSHRTTPNNPVASKEATT